MSFNIPLIKKTEGAIKNRQSSDTGNIGYTRHMMKTNKTHKTEKMNITDLNKNRGSTQVLVKGSCFL